MALRRIFRGREVVRTTRRGSQIELQYRAPKPGIERDRETVPFAVYEREVVKEIVSDPAREAGPES